MTDLQFFFYKGKMCSAVNVVKCVTNSFKKDDCGTAEMPWPTNSCCPKVWHQQISHHRDANAIYLFIYLFIYSFIHSFIHSFNFLIFIFCKNDNCDAKIKIPTKCESYHSQHIAKNNAIYFVSVVRRSSSVRDELHLKFNILITVWIENDSDMINYNLTQ